MGTSGASFSGRRVRPSELHLIQEVVESCDGLSRMELARTVCELLRWKRPVVRLTSSARIASARSPVQVKDVI